jgi:type II secretory pathway pseudopilin PulG
MNTTLRSQAGFSLLETVFAIGVLSAGALGMAGIFTQGVRQTSTAPSQAVMTAKAAEAIESVFSARDSHLLTWSQLQNVSHGGIFIDGPTPLKTDGPDGVVNTADDGPVESVALPGPDQLIGTADDVTVTFSNFTREIRIVTLSPDLREITVTITYKTGTTTNSFVLTAYISTFA